MRLSKNAAVSLEGDRIASISRSSPTDLRGQRLTILIRLSRVKRSAEIFRPVPPHGRSSYPFAELDTYRTTPSPLTPAPRPDRDDGHSAGRPRSPSAHGRCAWSP